MSRFDTLLRSTIVTCNPSCSKTGSPPVYLVVELDFAHRRTSRRVDKGNHFSDFPPKDNPYLQAIDWCGELYRLGYLNEAELDEVTLRLHLEWDFFDNSDIGKKYHQLRADFHAD